MDGPVEALDIAALALLIGVAAAWLWLAPARADEPREASPSLCGWLGAALLILAVTSVADLLMRTSALADVPLSQAWPEVPRVLTHSDFGRLWILRTVALGLLVLWWLWRRGTRPRAVAAGVAVVIAFVISATGHLGDEGAFSGESLNNTIHVVAGCLWGGGVVIYALAVLPSLRAGGVPPHLIARSTSRLSTLAAIALGLVVLTGLYNAWEEVGTLTALWQTDYGRILCLKLVLVAAMAGVGAFNRFVAVPAVQAWAQPPQLSPRADAPVRRLLRLLRIDVVLFVMIILAAATLANSTPAAHQ